MEAGMIYIRIECHEQIWFEEISYIDFEKRYGELQRLYQEGEVSCGNKSVKLVAGRKNPQASRINLRHTAIRGF